MQSALPTDRIKEELHVAIIMDGNGRWAKARGLPRIAGHRSGADSVRRVVENAPRLGISTLTLYAFSSDNWQRPRPEVSGLMQLLREYLKREAARCIKHGIRVNVIGRRDRLPKDVRKSIERTEAATCGGTNLHLRIAIDYSARDAIVAAASVLQLPSRDAFASAIRKVINDVTDTPDVDLLVRTGGEKRLSDFLLWESAYAELLFVDKMWPDFREGDLEIAVAEFKSRERRFGRVPESHPVAV